MYALKSGKNIEELLMSSINEESQLIVRKEKIDISSASYLSDLLYIHNNIDCLFKIIMGNIKSIHHDEIDPLATLEDELRASQKYFAEYGQTQDTDFLRMAKEELAHAKKFLMIIKNTMSSNPRFQVALSQYSELETELKKVTS